MMGDTRGASQFRVLSFEFHFMQRLRFLLSGPFSKIDNSELKTVNSKLFSSPPLQLIPQHVKVISVRRLHQIEGCLAFANHDAIVRLQIETHLAVKRQSDVFV